MCTRIAIIRSVPEGEFLKQIRFRTGDEERMDIIGRGAGSSKGATHQDFMTEVTGYALLGALIEISTQACDAARESDWFGLTPCLPKKAERRRPGEPEVSPTEPEPLGHWLRALAPRTILADHKGNACQIDTGEQHIHRTPNREFPALVVAAHPYEITEGHDDIDVLARWNAPFTVLKRGQDVAAEIGEAGATP